MKLFGFALNEEFMVVRFKNIERAKKFVVAAGGEKWKEASHFEIPEDGSEGTICYSIDSGNAIFY